MTAKEFLKLAFRQRAGSENLKVVNHKDGAGLTAVNFRKTYFSPTDHGSFYELDFGPGPAIWTLGELTSILLNTDVDATINADCCKLGGNTTEKWVEV